MRKNIYLLLLIWPLLSKAQDSCLPDYGLSVKMISVKGSSIAYIEEGKGKTLLLVHGLGGNISHWSNNIRPLSKSFHVVALDLPGFGYSDKNIDTSITDFLGFYADIIIEFIQLKHLGNVTIAGHSMGAQIAMIAALKDPATVKQLVLVAPAGLETFTKQEAGFLIANTPASFFESQDEAAIRASFKRNFYRQAPEKLLQERLQLKKCHTFSLYALAVSQGVKAMLQHPVKEQLKNIHQDVLIISGRQDAMIPNKFLHPSLTLEDVVKAGTDNISKSNSLYVNNAGHIVQYEQPDEVNNAITNFLNKLL